MNKVLAVLGVSALALMGCDSRDANAQSQVSADVGNPDSVNVLTVQEGYEVITPAGPADNMVADPGNPGVQVAPAGNNADMPNVSNPNNLPAGNAVAPVRGNNNSAVVNENVSEAVSPDGVVYQVDETVN